MRFGNQFGWDVSGELALRLQGILAVRCQSQTLCHAEDMCIDCHGRLVPDNGAHHVGGLASHSRERLQVVYVVRHFTVKNFHETLRHAE